MIREILEQMEHERLRSVACFSDKSRGRAREEKKSDVRLEFQRDRDRIIHTKSFRRLKHKTQVYIAPLGDHYRTRLTHTLEVSQVGRTIARALFLNEDLVEAIAMGHDIGHTPFGHTGERVLNKLSTNGFKHNEQSLRVVDFLEMHNDEPGLNLTFEVRDGIINHSGAAKASTLEGTIVKFADRIAYINHDIDDAIRAGVLFESDIPSALTNLLGHNSSKRIDTMVADIIKHSTDKDVITMSDEVGSAMEELRAFMFKNVYLDQRSSEQGERIESMLTLLFEYYMKHPEKISTNFVKRQSGELNQTVIDYIAGMTDQFAIEKFKELFLPTSIRRV